MEKIRAPFSDEVVEKLNTYQKSGGFHQFTCCSPESIPECLRAVREVDGEIIEGTSDGTLVAGRDGFVCPCGKYKQDWAYAFMVDDNV